MIMITDRDDPTMTMVVADVDVAAALALWCLDEEPRVCRAIIEVQAAIFGGRPVDDLAAYLDVRVERV